MRIRCPSCAATYEVADAMLKTPRTVRCAKCAFNWTAMPVADQPAAVPVPDPAPEPPPPPAAAEPPAPAPAVHAPEPPAAPEPPPPPVEEQDFFGPIKPLAFERMATARDLAQEVHRGSRPLAFAWAASIAILLLTGTGLWFGRDSVMRAWPPSARAYALLGPIHPAGWHP